MAVINRTPLSLYAALSSQSDISGNFYTQRKARTRIYGSDEFNQLRELVDQAVFPGFHELIRHAALATDDRGLTSYGSCSIWLKAEAIDERASVFDSNTLVWVMKRDPPLSQLFKIEPGHRAPWEDRDRLAVSKLDSGPLLDPSSSFDEILLRQGSNSADDDFVEVHIWEMLTTDSVERFTLPLHPVPDEVAPVAALRELLIQRGLPFEELP
jgi:hypothetical protein